MGTGIRGCAGRGPGGIRELFEAVFGEHREALAFDFRRFAQVSLGEVGRSVPGWEALAILRELRHERSHYWAEVVGWNRPADVTDLAAQVAASAAVHQADLFAWPWDGAEPTPEPADPAEVEAALAMLNDQVVIGGGGDE